MATATQIYQRLSPARGGIVSYSSLWLGTDHLLLVTNTGFREQYRRFFFRDIQGFYLEPNDWRTHWAGLWGVLAAVFVLFALLAGSLGTAMVGGAFFLIPFLWNFALGPCGKIYVITGVQITQLTPFTRQRKTRKMLARVQPLILAAQADLVAEPPLISAAPAGTEMPSAPGPELSSVAPPPA